MTPGNAIRLQEAVRHLLAHCRTDRPCRQQQRYQGDGFDRLTVASNLPNRSYDICVRVDGGYGNRADAVAAVEWWQAHFDALLCEVDREALA